MARLPCIQFGPQILCESPTIQGLSAFDLRSAVGEVPFNDCLLGGAFSSGIGRHQPTSED